MFRHKFFTGIIFILFCYIPSFGQSFSAFNSMLYPHSITASGLGEQGVATKNAFDAMQYNPANLVYSDKISLSYYRNPWNLINWVDYQFQNINVITKFENGGSLGLAYTYWDMGEWMMTTAESPEGEKYHAYERSLAAGYAMPLNDRWNIGGSIRYIWSPLSNSQYLDHLLFSFGTNYTPDIFSKRVNIGLSLMNFSTRIEDPSEFGLTIEERSVTSPPPAQLNIGINALVETNSFFDLNIILGAKKPFDKVGSAPNYEAQSSFESLINDWTDFPRDVTGQLGLSFNWRPLSLGNGISFFQEMYLGYFSVGPKDGANSFLTHGFDIGLKGKGLKASLGYAGRWHNYRADSYMRWEFPWETFQFSFSSDMNLFYNKNEETPPDVKPKNTIVSTGYSIGSPIGKMKEHIYGNDGKISRTMKNIWSIEADFYMDDNSAILSAFKYSRMQLNIDIFQYPYPTWEIKMGVETFSLESGFRYHPIEKFHPFFVQASVGIIRLNYVLKETTPRYSYQAFDELAVGAVLPVMDTKLVIIPKLGLTTLFLDELPNSKRLEGNSLFQFGLNVGYQL